MIHHLSIAARDPKHVAGVLAELMGGKAVPFPPNPGSFFALQLDEHGSGVEVYPAGTELQPGGSEGLLVTLTGRGSPHKAHMAIKAAKARALAPASRPSLTGSVAKSCARSRSQNSFRLSSLSSTTSTLFATRLPPDPIGLM